MATNNSIIAAVDLNDYLSGDENRRQKFIKALGDSFTEIGFALVSNHGVSEELRQRLFEVSQAFFALPEEVKQAYEDEEVHGQRGYIGKGKETAKGFAVPDLKEFFHIGQELPENHPLREVYPDNRWPKEVEDLKEVTLEVYRTFENTGRHLLRALAIYLELPETYFDSEIEHGNSVLRLLHYYPLKETPPPGAVRAAAHEDINLITLLMGANAEGLQAQTKEGKWIDVMPEPGQIVINMGDMLQRLTNNRMRSTTHRVINPDGEAAKKARISTPFFLHPVPSMDLSALSSCIDEDHPKVFEDMTAGEYLDERLRELGLLKSEAMARPS